MRVTAESKTRKPLLDVQDMGGGTPALPASPLGHARVLRKKQKVENSTKLIVYHPRSVISCSLCLTWYPDIRRICCSS